MKMIGNSQFCGICNYEYWQFSALKTNYTVGSKRAKTERACAVFCVFFPKQAKAGLLSCFLHKVI